jgi:hypothetical protein
MARVRQYIVAALLLLAGAAGASTIGSQAGPCDNFFFSPDTLAAEMGPQRPDPQPAIPTLLPQDAGHPQSTIALQGIRMDRNPQSTDVAAITQQALDQLTAGHVDEAESLAMSLLSQQTSCDGDPQASGDPQSADNPQSNGRAWAIVAAARERAGRHASALRAYRLFLASCPDAQTRQYITQRIDACQDALHAADVASARRSARTDASPDDQAAPEPAASATTSQPACDRSFSAQQLRELAKVEQEFSVESSEHFVVHARNSRLAKLVTKEAETALGRICSDLLAGTEYPHSVEIYVYSDHDDYLAHATDAPEWSGGAFTFQARDGQTIRRISLTQLDKCGKFATIMLDRVLPHEMCHLVVAEYFGDATCPLFLNEGLAMLAETGVDNERVALAGAALAGKEKIKLDQLFVKGRQDMEAGGVKPEVFYAESYSFLSYLHTRLTRKQFGAFVEHLKDGCTVADSLQRALFVPADDSFIPQLWSAWTEVAISQAQDLHAIKGDLSMPD